MQVEILRVVVAEDDDQLAELITSLLHEDARFEVVGRARTGDEAVELAGAHRPDLVVMDLSMPGCDGVEATRLIRAMMSIPSALFGISYSSGILRAKSEPISRWI